MSSALLDLIKLDTVTSGGLNHVRIRRLQDTTQVIAFNHKELLLCIPIYSQIRVIICAVHSCKVSAGVDSWDVSRNQTE